MGRSFGIRAAVAVIALVGCQAEPAFETLETDDSDAEEPDAPSRTRDDAVVPDATPIDCSEGSATALYDKRIAPLLEDDRPSSCNRCHLSGVDLSLYIQADPCSTMVCMYEEGLVDFDDPEESLVLDWIDRGAPDSPGITEDIIAEEHAAMLEWIGFYAECGTELCEVTEGACGDEATYKDCDLPAETDDKPFDDPGGCEPIVLESMFAAKVYAWRGRCGPCHFDNAASHIEAPRWVEVGECDAGSLGSMRNVIDAGYLDAEDPAASLLLLKPLAEDLGGVEHGGHNKMHALEDPAYQDMLAWIERWAECR